MKLSWVFIQFIPYLNYLTISIDISIISPNPLSYIITSSLSSNGTDIFYVKSPTISDTLEF